MSEPLVVSIGTTHPLNVAGLGRDARVATDYGVAHNMAVAAVSAQDRRGVHDIVVLPPESVRAQLSAIDVTRAAAVRIGAIGSADNAAAVCDALQGLRVPIVFDPVMGASAGGSLYKGDAARAVHAVYERTHAIVTPNLDEAQRLADIAIESADDMIAAG